MTPETKIANLQISGAKHMWKLLGPGMYNARPLFPVTVRELLQNSADAQRSAGVTRAGINGRAVLANLLDSSLSPLEHQPPAPGMGLDARGCGIDFRGAPQYSIVSIHRYRTVTKQQTKRRSTS